MVTLGFDVSSTCVGWATSKDDKITDAGFVEISKLTSAKEKTQLVLDNIRLKEYPDHINIEAPLVGFGRGKSSSHTIITLIRYNAIFEYIITEKYSKSQIHLINPSTARKQVFGVGRIKGMKAKPFVRQELEKIMDTSPWIVINRIGNWHKRNEDTYDGIVCALYKNPESQ